MAGLNITRLVNVSVDLAPLAAPVRNFGVLMIAGPTEGVINTTERVREYTAFSEVAASFSSGDPEYQAAELFFSQRPQPALLKIGRWAASATHGLLVGGILSASQQAIANFTAVSSGGLTISTNGSAHALSGLNFSGVTNLNGVAAILDAALPAGASVLWDSVQGRFTVFSETTGGASTVSFATAPGSGTDISTLMRLRSTNGGYTVAGIVAEDPDVCVTAIQNADPDWYAFMFAPTTEGDITIVEHLAVAALIEAQNPYRIYGVTIQDTAVLNPSDTTSFAYLAKAAGYGRTVPQYSSSSLYAMASFFGRGLTVDFTANNSMVTMMFKTEPGVTSEILTETQANALKAVNCNVFAKYSNDKAIIQYGTMANGTFFDERQGTDWLQNDITVGLFNLLYQSPTKIPQTDAGLNMLANVVEQSFVRGINNGLIAPGQWNGPPLSQLKTGDYLPKGWYLYTPRMASQAQADREARIAPTLQAAIKLAGAFHSADVLVNVNR